MSRVSGLGFDRVIVDTLSDDRRRAILTASVAVNATSFVLTFQLWL